jgi:hypothetical protein
VVGTIDDMSPEPAKLNELDVDTRSDIYALGVLLDDLLAQADATREPDQDRHGETAALYREILDVQQRVLGTDDPALLANVMDPSCGLEPGRARAALLHAQMLLLVDRTDEYGQVCRQFLELFRQSENWEAVCSAVLACVLRPHAVADPLLSLARGGAGRGACASETRCRARRGKVTGNAANGSSTRPMRRVQQSGSATSSRRA